jgi:hypothetical protein
MFAAVQTTASEEAGLKLALRRLREALEWVVKQGMRDSELNECWAVWRKQEIIPWL